MHPNWKETPLGEILTERRETPSIESLENGEVSIISKIGFNKGTIELRSDGKTKTGMILIRPGDLVISGINAAKGAIAIYPESEQKPIAATIHYGAYASDKERVDVKYLWWFLRSAPFREIVQHHVPGGIKTELKANRLLPIPIPLPPLSEQHRIVGRIEAMGVRITQAKRLREESAASLRFYKLSLLSAAFRGKFSGVDIGSETGESLLEKLLAEKKQLTRNGNNDIPSLPNPRLLPAIPKRWIWVNLEHTCSFITDGFHNTPKQTSSGFPYVLATHIKPEGIDFANSFFVSETDHIIQYSRTKVCRGDILVVNIGAGCGTPAIVNVDFPFSFKNVAILKRLNLIDSKYMFYYLLSRRDEVLREITKGGAQPFLSLKSLRTIPFPLAPLSEQMDIVSRLVAIFRTTDEVNHLQNETRKELNALLPSVLDKAFKGKL